MWRKIETLMNNLFYRFWDFTMGMYEQLPETGNKFEFWEASFVRKWISTDKGGANICYVVTSFQMKKKIH